MTTSSNPERSDVTDREILMAAYKLLDMESKWDPLKRRMEVDEDSIGGTCVMILTFDENDKLVDQDSIWWSDE